MKASGSNIAEPVAPPLLYQKIGKGTDFQGQQTRPEEESVQPSAAFIARKNNSQVAGGDVIGNLPRGGTDETEPGARGGHQRVEIVGADSREKSDAFAPGRC